ncbi:hypothetical protein T10_460 [Trichinella papuae]|uniref:Uncharacterized protein n=1 Tax=Trichinella papuae TaxID=268474 RepID=A0A0V1MZ26_9BILA|nr:hypothetical protein T10_460 [Trichinella papuae]
MVIYYDMRSINLLLMKLKFLLYIVLEVQMKERERKGGQLKCFKRMINTYVHVIKCEKCFPSCSEYGKPTSGFGNAKQAILVTHCYDRLISRIPKTASSTYQAATNKVTLATQHHILCMTKLQMPILHDQVEAISCV